MMHKNIRWFALRVQQRHEHATATALRLKRLEAFSPTVRTHYSGFEAPLFPGCVFCRFEYVKRITVLNTPGVLSIVGNASGPAAVADDEVEALRAALDAGGAIQQWPYVRDGERVQVTRGPLKGLRGVLVRENGDWRIILNVTAIVRSVAIKVNPDCLGIKQLHANVTLPFDYKIAG